MQLKHYSKMYNQLETCSLVESEEHLLFSDAYLAANNLNFDAPIRNIRSSCFKQGLTFNLFGHLFTFDPTSMTMEITEHDGCKLVFVDLLEDLLFPCADCSASGPIPSPTPGPTPGPGSGICSEYTDGYCGGVKSCSEYHDICYNINFTTGYATISFYDGMGMTGACGKISSGCAAADADAFVGAAAPLAWFNKPGRGNCKNGLQSQWGTDCTIKDSQSAEVCFKLTNVTDDTKPPTKIKIQDKCDGNCTKSPGSCNTTCHDYPCGADSGNCINWADQTDMSACYDPRNRCAIAQLCTSTQLDKIEKVTNNHTENLNNKYNLTNCCKDTGGNKHNDWCSGFYPHFDLACAKDQTEVATRPKWTNLCGPTGNNCVVKYERISC